MEEPLQDQDLLQAIRETEDRVRKQVEEARREAEQTLSQAQETARRLRSEAETSLRERVGRLREKGLREIRSETENMAGGMAVQLQEMEQMARVRMETSGLGILNRLLPPAPASSEELPNP